ncbi:enoyl-CoA hydratase-related protein [Actinomadura sp. 7K534]|uniref:enoyl-CoA hydratase/isomerase family protein n=1 Tax=Actinomadura sp. 7K534 TaxID=2530366 RepID=UPI001053CD20|nr:enoyl-CoA hydratase-related protein [Actinomadura sp. 7K534]TDB98188.1 enoyl-CoA hydratase [Actinomadura sp. 7K534]
MSVDVDRDGGLVRVVLNAPERRNALTPEEFELLGAELTRIARTPSDRAVLLTGAGTAFCAGAQLAEAVPDESTLALMGRINEAARALHRLPQPIVAAVNGPAYGAGMSIALGCDIVVAADSATFCQVFVKRGLVPDFGSSWLLPRIVGRQAAKRLVLTGEPVGAAEALALGIAAQVVPAAELRATAESLARTLADGPPIAQRLAKRLLDASSTNGFDDQLEAEAAGAAIASASEDVAEAFAAFAAKRPPVFRGR